MNDLENHGLLQLPGLCYAKPLPRLLNSFLGRCLSLLLQLCWTVGCTCIFGGHITHTFHCSSGLWALNGPEKEVGAITRAWELTGKSLLWV